MLIRQLLSRYKLNTKQKMTVKILMIIHQKMILKVKDSRIRMNKLK